MVSSTETTQTHSSHGTLNSTGDGETAAPPPASNPGDVELSNVSESAAEAPSLPLAEDIMQCARLGEVGLIQKMFDSGKYSAQYRDAENITPLHWAAISNQYATCDFLVKAGADINAKGGESGATPAMWAAQRCHYYVVNLLLKAGTDPLLVDGQGYNILHLATIDGNAYLLVLLLHQEIPVDVTDPQGHTSLMWAAYRGYPACVDLLLRWGASVNAVDEKGLNALHWALVKGSVPCIQKIIEYGVDRFAVTAEGKTPAVVADEMKSTAMWHRALSECGYEDDGSARALPLGLTTVAKDRQILTKMFFFTPFVVLWVVISLLSGLPVYAGVPIALVASFVMPRGIHFLAQWGPPEFHNIQRTSFLAGIFAGSLFWVAFRWLFYVVPTTFGSHPFLNFLFAGAGGLTAYFFILSMLEDPGYVPKLASRSSQKKVMEELFSLWKFDERNFCIHCMIQKPLRSKHCKPCGKCVARHDHHCPWINNCVGNNNLRHFFLYILAMEVGVIIFVRLVLAYIELLPSPAESNSECNILPPAICELVLKDTWTVVLTLWAALQLVWITMLLVVQTVQISQNQTTYEKMKGHHHHETGPPGAAPAPTFPGPGGPGPAGAGTASESGAPGRRRHDGFMTQWKKLLGLDAFVATASDASSAGNRRRGNPYTRGIIVNCKDFWTDPAPYFGRRIGGEAFLGGEPVNYARMYDTPLRTRRGAGFRYQQLDAEEEAT